LLRNSFSIFANLTEQLASENVAKNTYKFQWILCYLILLVGLIISGPVITGENFRLNREVLTKAEIKYGKAAVDRLLLWEELIRHDKNTTDLQKLEKVNRFFNKMEFASDFDVWGVKDYWATPIQFICKNAGDCEDFAIAKYFTLKAMGVAEEKINITYVKALRYNMPHMVLTYYSKPGAEPLILDNLVDSIDNASKRTDLVPIFTFNGTGLWLAHQRGQGKLVGASNRITPWQDLLQRMSDNTL
jgi:predicted transglutaminase-like cysteine proteinase